eukprot:9330207-Karenia_brevis.AAC.1
MKKDSVLWQLHSRMIVVLRTMPTRAKVVKDQLVVAPPTAKERLGEIGHQVEAQTGRLECYRCGQHWKDKHQYIGDLQCPCPEIGGSHKGRDHDCATG